MTRESKINFIKFFREGFNSEPIISVEISLYQVDREAVNMFCFSKLWQSQIVSSAGRAIDENQFIVPGTTCVAASHEGRRNLTDVQETSQWIGGEQIPELILKDLMSCDLAGFGLCLCIFTNIYVLTQTYIYIYYYLYLCYIVYLLIFFTIINKNKAH